MSVCARLAQACYLAVKREFEGMPLKSDDGSNPWNITTTNFHDATIGNDSSQAGKRFAHGSHSCETHYNTMYRSSTDIATITVKTCTRGKRKGIDGYLHLFAILGHKILPRIMKVMRGRRNLW